MKLVYVSHEYPPENANGGIATYTFQIARAMASRGHEVIVICASKIAASLSTKDNLTVYRLLDNEQSKFKEALFATIQAIDKSSPIDCMECPDYRADLLGIKNLLPHVTLVVRLHGPLTFLYDYTCTLYFFLGIWKWEGLRKKMSYLYRKFIKRNFYTTFFKHEYQIVMEADQVHCPSKSVQQLALRYWQIPKVKTSVIDNVFNPNSRFLAVPPLNAATERLTDIFFLGRLEIFKGILYFIEVIPRVLKKYPWMKFHFIGRPGIAPGGIPMDLYLKKQLGPNAAALVFHSADYDKIPAAISQCQLCILPSLWESFGYVCLEAMSAARPVIVSKRGGMAEIVEDYKSGILVTPQNIQEIVRAVSFFADNPAQLHVMGDYARERVLQQYSTEKVCAHLELELGYKHNQVSLLQN